MLYLMHNVCTCAQIHVREQQNTNLGLGNRIEDHVLRAIECAATFKDLYQHQASIIRLFVCLMNVVATFRVAGDLSRKVIS